MATGRGGLGAYARVLRHGPALRPFAAAVVARLPVSMAPLGMLLLVQAERGSYALAGLVTGAFAAGAAVGSPLWGRAMDRLGQARVLAPAVVASAALLAALAVATGTRAPDAVLVALAGASGACGPPISAAMRATWRLVLADPALRRAGFALDAVAVETVFVAGPLLLSLLLVTTPPLAPLLVTAGLLAGGGLAYSATAPARRRPSPPEPDPHPVPDSVPEPELASDPEPGAAPAPGRRAALAVATAGVPAVLAVSLATSVGFGVLDTSLAATAREVLGDEGRLGVLFAAIAGGSAIGGLAYGAARHPAHEHRRLPVLLGVFAAGLAPLPVLLSGGAPPTGALLPLLFVAGLAIAPSLIVGQNLVDRFAPQARRTEAQAWLSTTYTAGGAVGAALAGLLVDALGVPTSFTGAVVALLVAVAVAVGAQRSWTRLDDRAPSAPAPAPASAPAPAPAVADRDR
ncbi:MFS transporter [Quadrisphaera sp. DSM 44207]|uniref:MFS transporter n=1 Tax=Quadrisphaera sp. DSM 44207 TaxID=1881057 RepID=UPI00115FDC57|nr:MFS transporter [Quadrisphaera sp. DSM 44207]